MDNYWDLDKIVVFLNGEVREIEAPYADLVNEDDEEWKELVYFYYLNSLQDHLFDYILRKLEIYC